MKLVPLALATLFFGLGAAGLPLGSAESACEMADTVTTVGNGFGYVAQDPPTSGYAISTWMYQETNGREGLTRGGTALLNGATDWCESDLDGDGERDYDPDTLLSGIGVRIGQPVGPLAPLPGMVSITYVGSQGAAPFVTNAWGHECGPLVLTASDASVTCDAPDPMPVGFTAGCTNLALVAGYHAPPLQGAPSFRGDVACGAANADCPVIDAAPGFPGGVCQATATNAGGALPMTCSSKRGPGAYTVWIALCQFS